MPGPDNIYVLVQSITNSRKHGIATSLGLATGVLVHTTLVAFGVSAILKQSENLFFAIKLFGALYLCYLAYQAFQSDEQISLQNSSAKKGLLRLYKQGFIMNVLNPKVSIFFLAFFPGFLYSNSLSTVTQFYVLGGIFMVQTIVIFSLIAILSGSLASYLKMNPSFNSKLKWIKIVVFLGIAFFILFS
jgi:threonine/homoserine/homoserine lactone efflux protein